MLLGLVGTAPVSIPVVYVPCHIFQNPADDSFDEHRVLLQRKKLMKSCAHHASTTFHQHPTALTSLYSCLVMQHLKPQH